MAQVTSPIILDSTGQQIHSDLQQIKNVLTTPSAAADITFDNTGTGMQADDVQDAITELKSNLTELGTAVLLGSNHTTSNQMTIPLSDSMLNYRSIRIIASFVLASNNCRIVTTEIDKTYVEYLLNLTSYSYFLDLHTFFNTSTYTSCNVQLSANNEVKMREKSNNTTEVYISVYGIK